MSAGLGASACASGLVVVGSGSGRVEGSRSARSRPCRRCFSSVCERFGGDTFEYVNRVVGVWSQVVVCLFVCLFVCLLFVCSFVRSFVC
jgi:hypothetical protein